MTTSTTTHPTTTPNRRTILTALVAAGTLATLTACGSTTESAVGAVPPTIGIGAPTEAPVTTTPAPPAPEPVEVPLLSKVGWVLSASEPDGAGGSAEIKQVGARGVGVRAYAWHGYNGSGQARATASTGFDASPYLTDEVPVARVEVQYSASGSGVLKAPWDRSATVSVGAGSDGAFRAQPGIAHLLFHESIDHDAEVNSELPHRFDNGGSFSYLVTPEHPRVGFSLEVTCEARGGPMAVALFHEGYCDFYERGGVQLDTLSVVVTPLPDHHIVDGTPTPRN